MKRLFHTLLSRTLWARAACLGSLLAATAAQAAGPLDQPAVRRYVTGWQQHDGAKVQKAFARQGHYLDPSVLTPLDGAEIARHVHEHRDARFELLGASQPSADVVELRWKATWPDARGESEFTDRLRLKGGVIELVESEGLAPPEAAKLVADYEVMHDHPTPERMAALFTPDFEVFGSTIPSRGLHHDDYIGFLSKFPGYEFRQRPGTPLLQTKDKRLVMRWTLKSGEYLKASGVDFINVEQGRIRKIVGVY